MLAGHGRRAPPGHPAAAKPDDAATRSPLPGRMFVVGRVLDPKASRCRTRRSPSPCGASSCSPAPVPKGASRRRPAMGRATRRAGSGSMRPAPRRPSTRSSPPPRWRPATASAGPTSTPTRTGHRPRSGSCRSRSSRAGSSTSRASPSRARWSRSRRSGAPSAPTVLAQGRDIEEHSEGPYRWWGRVHDGPGWPKPATTDADGRFILHGIGRGLHARLSVLDPRFAPQTIEVATDAPAGVKTLKAVLLPARTLTGRVTYADTGRPAAHAEVHVGGSVGQGGVREGGIRYLTAEADADGRFRVSVMPGDRVSCLGRGSRRATLPPRRQAPGMAQGGDRADRRPGAAPRRAAPRQGHRGGHRSARRGCPGAPSSRPPREPPAPEAADRP